jgi:hypothetical protein
LLETELDKNQYLVKKKETKKVRLPPSAIFSQGEKDLYREALKVKE